MRMREFGAFHPALQPGAEVVDPSKGKRRFPRVRRAGARPSGTGFRGVSGPRSNGKILESENANGPLSYSRKIRVGREPL